MDRLRSFIATHKREHDDLREPYMILVVSEAERIIAEHEAAMDMLAEAITQLGGALTMNPMLLVERKRWVMTGPEQLPDMRYRWQVRSQRGGESA